MFLLCSPTRPQHFLPRSPASISAQAFAPAGSSSGAANGVSKHSTGTRRASSAATAHAHASSSTLEACCRLPPRCANSKAAGKHANASAKRLSWVKLSASLVGGGLVSCRGGDLCRDFCRGVFGGFCRDRLLAAAVADAVDAAFAAATGGSGGGGGRAAELTRPRCEQLSAAAQWALASSKSRCRTSRRTSMLMWQLACRCLSARTSPSGSPAPSEPTRRHSPPPPLSRAPLRSPPHEASILREIER